MTSSAEASSAATDQDTAVDTTADLIAGWLGGAGEYPPELSLHLS